MFLTQQIHTHIQDINTYALALIVFTHYTYTNVYCCDNNILVPNQYYNLYNISPNYKNS